MSLQAAHLRIERARKMRAAALTAPLWGRVGDRFGNKLLVQRSLVSFILVMSAMAYATRPWHLFALRALQGFFAGYGALNVSMAALSAPRAYPPAASSDAPASKDARVARQASSDSAHNRRAPAVQLA